MGGCEGEEREEEVGELRESELLGVFAVSLVATPGGGTEPGWDLHGSLDLSSLSGLELVDPTDAEVFSLAAVTLSTGRGLCSLSSSLVPMGMRSGSRVL